MHASHLSDLVAGRNVEVDYGKYDRYGLILGKVMVNGNDVNLEQVEAGTAWHYKKYQREQTASLSVPNTTIRYGMVRSEVIRNKIL
jgi:endonuclease YncB( thermonuclease family)